MLDPRAAKQKVRDACAARASPRGCRTHARGYAALSLAAAHSRRTQPSGCLGRALLGRVRARCRLPASSRRDPHALNGPRQAPAPRGACAAQKKKAVAAEAEGGGDEGATAAAPTEAAADGEQPAEPAPTADADGGDDDDDFGLGKKKKKKAKKKDDEDEEAEGGAEGRGDADAAAADDDDDFGLGKKKKKKAAKKVADDEEALGGGDDDDGDEDGGEVPLPADINDDLGVQWEGEVRGIETQISIAGDRDYKYDELLARMFQLLLANNPELAGDRKRFVMKPPQVVRDGAKKVVFVNFPEICKAMRRTNEPKAVEHVIRKYVSEYVMCSSCKSPDTDLHKENRLYFVQCNKCGARRSVAAITAGYKAQIGRRIKTG